MNIYWDYSRSIILIAGFGEVFAVDTQTGLERLRFPVMENRRGGCYFYSTIGCGFVVSSDGVWIFIYGNTSLGIWNIDTLKHTFLPVETLGNAVKGALISPDGHYLVVSRSAVRVWDLWNLADNFEERVPVATYGIGNEAVLSVRFVDNQTLEVIVRISDGTATTLYDVLTGVPQ